MTTGSSTSHTARTALLGNVYISHTRMAGTVAAGAVGEDGESGHVLEISGFWHTGGQAACTAGQARYCPPGAGHWHLANSGGHAPRSWVIERTVELLQRAGYDVHTDIEN